MPPENNLVSLSIPTPTNESISSAEQALTVANSRTITTAEEYEFAAEDLKTIKAKWSDIENQRKALVAPINAAHKAVQSFFAKPLDWLAQAESVLKRKMVAYNDAQEKLRREEQAKLEAEARREREKLEKRAEKAAAAGQVEKADVLANAATSVVAPIIEREAPKVAGIKSRDVWLFKIENPAEVPREFCMPDEKAIGAVVRALKERTAIKGVKVWKEGSIAASHK